MKNNRNSAQVMNTVWEGKKQNTSCKRAEVNARRKVTRSWALLEHSVKYQKVTVKESCVRATLQIEDELFDGILLNLHEKNSVKSYNAQKRILRRIVEKRQAQLTHRKIGRTESRFVSHMLRHCASESMNDIRHYQMCA